MKMPAAYATGIFLSCVYWYSLWRDPELRVVVRLSEGHIDRVVHPSRPEDRSQLGLEWDERGVLHDLHVGLVPEGGGRRDGGRGGGLVGERVHRGIVIAAPVGTREAELAVEEVREGGASVGRSEPVGDPAGLGDVPLAGFEARGRRDADARGAVVAGRDRGAHDCHAALGEVGLDLLEHSRVVTAVAVVVLERDAARREAGGLQERLALGGVALIVRRGVQVEQLKALGAWPDHLVERLIDGRAA